MKFNHTHIANVIECQIEPHSDGRGLFGRTFCTSEFADHGLPNKIIQTNTSYNRLKGTFRGMHFQLPPYAEAKLVRCVSGKIFDIVLDLRRNSKTYCQWLGIELDAKKRNALFIPEGCAHGFQTLCDETEILYNMFQSYHAEYASGVRWNDAAFDIKLPLPISSISDKDKNYPDYIEIS